MLNVYILILFFLISASAFADVKESLQQKVMKEVKASAENPATDNDSISIRILQKVQAVYQSLETYKAQGTVTANFDRNSGKTATHTDFSIMLKKPNLYLVSWIRKNDLNSIVTEHGAIWNDGSEAYLYLRTMKAYSKIENEQTAFLMATGLSGSGTFMVPLFFSDIFKEMNLVEQLTDLKWEGIEKVGNEDCYIISGKRGKGLPVFRKEVFWIAKSSYRIVKYSYSFEPAEGTNVEMSDRQIAESLRAGGQKVTRESKRQMKEMMKQLAESAGKTTGSSTEVYVQISSPALNSKDFQFKLPEGTVLKESLLEVPFKRP